MNLLDIFESGTCSGSVASIANGPVGGAVGFGTDDSASIYKTIKRHRKNRKKKLQENIDPSLAELLTAHGFEPESWDDSEFRYGNFILHKARNGVWGLVKSPPLAVGTLIRRFESDEELKHYLENKHYVLDFLNESKLQEGEPWNPKFDYEDTYVIDRRILIILRTQGFEQLSKFGFVEGALVFEKANILISTNTHCPHDWSVELRNDNAGNNYDVIHSFDDREILEYLTEKHYILDMLQESKSEKSKWLRKMIELRQQYHDDMLKPQREKFDAAVKSGANTHNIGAHLGVPYLPAYQDSPNLENEIRAMGTTFDRLIDDAKFQDWARKKGLEIPEFPKDLREVKTIGVNKFKEPNVLRGKDKMKSTGPILGGNPNRREKPINKKFVGCSTEPVKRNGASIMQEDSKFQEIKHEYYQLRDEISALEKLHAQIALEGDPSHPMDDRTAQQLQDITARLKDLRAQARPAFYRHKAEDCMARGSYKAAAKNFRLAGMEPEAQYAEQYIKMGDEDFLKSAGIKMEAYIRKNFGGITPEAVYTSAKIIADQVHVDSGLLVESFLKEYYAKSTQKAGFLPYFIDENDFIYFLFCKSSNPAYGGDRFMICKGRVDPNETARDAALREAKEELGLIHSNLYGPIIEAWNGMLDSDQSGHSYKFTLFAGEVKDPRKFGPHDYEISQVKWMQAGTFGEVGRVEHVPIVMAALHKILKLRHPINEPDEE